MECVTIVKRPQILFVVKTPRGNSVALMDESADEILWCDNANDDEILKRDYSH